MMTPTHLGVRSPDPTPPLVRRAFPRRRRSCSALLCAALAVSALFGCDGTESTEELPVAPPTLPAPPVVQEDPPVGDPAPVGLCDGLAPRWFSEEVAGWTAERFLGFTPNEGLLVSSDLHGGGGFVMRVDDGQLMGRGVLGGLLDVDANWHRRLDYTGEQVAVREVVTSEPLTFLAADGMGTGTGALSDDGRRFALVRCDEQGLNLVVRDIDAVQTLFDAPLRDTAGACPEWNDVLPTVRFGRTVDDLIVGVPRTGNVHLLDVAAGTESVHHVHDERPDENIFGAPPRALLSLAVDAQASVLATTGGDGLLRRFKLPGMIELGEPVAVGVFPLTLSVYANPRLASSVAVSPDGQVIAAVSPGVFDEETYTWLERPLPMLVSAATGELLVLLDVPEAEQQSWDPAAVMPGGLTFSPSGRALAAQLGHGASVWSCPAFRLQASAPLSVLIDGPTEIVAGEPATFTATHLGSDALHGHSFYVDGELVWGSGGLERTAQVWIMEPGEYEVSVVVDDGVSSGSTSMTVTATAAP